MPFLVGQPMPHGAFLQTGIQMSRPIRRTPLTNALLVAGILAYFVVIGIYIWIRWDIAARTGEASQSSAPGALWAMVIIGGPVVLLAAFIWGKVHNRALSRRVDPDTPSDDPSKGMSGHD